MLFLSHVLDEVSQIREVIYPKANGGSLACAGGPIPEELQKLYMVMAHYKEQLARATHEKIRRFAALPVLVAAEFNQDSPEEVIALAQYDFLYAIFWGEVRLKYPDIFSDDENGVSFDINPEWMIVYVE